MERKAIAMPMPMALAADAVFSAAVFFEILAALSILQLEYGTALREEFAPVLAFYRQQAVPILASGARFAYANAPQWFQDASILAAVLFFLFFIAQARKAMAPYEDVCPPRGVNGVPSRIETAIDWLLPAAICSLGAFLIAPTLLPFLTLPAALVLAMRRLGGKPCWFEVSRSYYVNLLILAAVVGGVLVLQR
ncbi:MAG: hypothetical protein HY765_01340 [Rhodomicrobium sp.]|nr:hypothetical protein [Rhodomicrobium sp.]